MEVPPEVRTMLLCDTCPYHPRRKASLSTTRPHTAQSSEQAEYCAKPVLSFFPQITEGPIGRFDKLANQLYDSHKLEFSNILTGFVLIGSKIPGQPLVIIQR
jgi:hypothetical protein